MADAFRRKLNFHLHVRSVADDVEDGADAPDLVAYFVALGKGVGHGVLLGKARGHGLGQDGHALLAGNGSHPALGHGALTPVFFDEFRRDFSEETAGHVGRNAAVHGPGNGVGDVELPFGTGDADVGQAPFFFNLFGIHQGPTVREQTFVEAGQKDDRKFKAFRGVEGHEGDLRFAAFKVVDVADQGYIFEEVLQVAVGVAVHVVFSDGQEFADVFLAAYALGIVFGFFIEHVAVARVFDDLFDEAQDVEAVDLIEEIKDHGGKVFKGRLGPFGDGDGVGRRQGFKEGDSLPFCVGCHVFHRRSSDVALRDVDDTGQAQAVFGIIQEPQVSEDVLDFLAVVELRAADHGIRNGVAHQFFFEDTGLGVGPDEDGHVAVGFVADFVAVVDGAGDVIGFVVFGLGLVMDDLVARRVFRPKCLSRPAFVVVDDGVGGVQDGLGRAVILFELDRRCVGIVPGKVDDVADVGTAPGVDTLVGIADDADVAPLGSQDLSKGILGVVRILIFVDQDVLEPFLILFPDVVFFFQEADGQEQEVVEVKSVVFLELCLIERIGFGDFLLVKVFGLAGKGFGIHEDVLSRRNRPQDRPRRELFIVEVQFFQAVLDEHQLVRRIVNGEIPGVAVKAVDFKAQQFRTEGMEGAEPNGIGLGPDEVLDALFHFLGGLIGKGNGQDAVGRDAELQEVGDAAGQNLGLPRSGAGGNEKRALCMVYGLTLAVVQGVENRIHTNCYLKHR